MTGNGQRPVVVAVDRISFSVQESEIFGVLGPNGSGKSTLIRLIATLLLPDDGTITVFGHDVVRQPMQVQRLINRVSVEASFFKHMVLRNFDHKGNVVILFPHRAFIVINCRRHNNVTDLKLLLGVLLARLLDFS